MIFEKVRKILSEQLGVDEDSIQEDSLLAEDLGADSVDLVELIMAMEEEFELGMAQEDEVKALKTVGDAVNYVASKLNK